MKRDDFKQLKEKEKAHLREIQTLKQRLREAERIRSIGKALSDVDSDDASGDFDDALKKVKIETLEGEARLDIALESVPEAGPTNEPDPVVEDEELRKARAAELVRHMKISMGLEDPVSDPVRTDRSTSDSDRDKTIGRMNPGDD